MDQNHYVSTDFPEDLKQLIKAKEAEVTELKIHQLALKAEHEKLKNSCDHLASQIEKYHLIPKRNNSQLSYFIK